jgi:hypothetical protein
VGLDGSQSTTLTDFDSTGAEVQQQVWQTSADGLTFNHTWFSQFGAWNGGPATYTETAVNIPNANGSYSWSDSTSDGTEFSSSTHTVDANGVDTFSWSLNQRPTPTSNWLTESGSIRIDTATEAKDLDIVKRLYATIFNRDPQRWELQTSAYWFNGNQTILEKSWAAYVTPTGFDAAQMATDLMNLPGFAFGSGNGTFVFNGPTNYDGIAHFYQNAMGHRPQISITGTSSSDVINWVNELNANTITPGAVVAAISESSEHVANGNVHVDLSSTLTSNHYDFADTTNKAQAADIVKSIYDVALDRDPTAGELTTDVNDIITGYYGIEDTVYNLMHTAEYTSKYGSLSNADFISQMFVNTLSRLPTAQELQYWVSELNSGAFLREDIIKAFADSTDHGSVGNVHAINPGPGTHATGSAQLFDAGASGTVTTGSTGVTLTSNDNVTATAAGDWVNVTGTQNTLSVSSSEVYLQARSQVSLSGTADTVEAAAGATLSLAAGATVTMTGSNDRLNMASNTNATVTGTGDTVDVTGTGAKLNINNATIYVESSATVTVNGTGDTIIHGSPPAAASAAALSAPTDAATMSGSSDNTTLQASSLPVSGTVTSANATPSMSAAGATTTNNATAIIPGGAEHFNGSANDTTIGSSVGDKITTLVGATHVGANGTSAVAATGNVFDQLAGSISAAQRDGSSSPILLPSFNGGAGTGVTTPVFSNILLPQAQQLINAMASFAPPDAAPTTAIVSPPGGVPVVLAANLH